MATGYQLTLFGRIFIHANIRLLTGLHIGAESSDFVIGGVDNPVIRDVITNQPYIPGSSLKGKMRSLAEKSTGAPQNKPIGSGVRIHVAEDLSQYQTYWVNPVFGIPSEVKFDPGAPTRLIVRDVFMSQDSLRELEKSRTDQPFTEIKTEVSIDRVTAKANPRPMERVPRGVVFAGAEMVYSVYQPKDLDYFLELVKTLKQVEDDYLGGQGSRGSGKIQFEQISVGVKARENYVTEVFYQDTAFGYLDDLLGNLDDLYNWLTQLIPMK